MNPFRIYEPHELGKDGYPVAWHETVKHVVREEAGFRCVRCRHPYVSRAGKWSSCDKQCEHGSDDMRWLNRMGKWTTVPMNIDADCGAQAAWRILTVHHLNGRKFDLRWWNLVALCQRCHLQIQGKVQMERVWAWEHSEWFKPYAAGWYAYAYLGEDLTRDEAMDRIEELLALERVC